ncbi:uncharacterized protein LOC109706723 [Ananas comosus]|uniref:Uncharacterized protein LOC109706723 n=1 Tax=Ananas comosus TaxID=4615 RepID=A0A6P5EPV2_ANACO|nr:uncharacterized protein LOC109706723 [Ananas comosus]
MTLFRNAELLELPFEAIALRFNSLPAAATWLAVAAAAVGIWRIRAVGSRSDASSPLSAPAPSPEPETSTPLRADTTPTEPSRIRSCAAPKERFTAYYGVDASYGEEEEEEEEEHVGVDGEVTAPLVGVGLGWEVNGDGRRGISDLGWYRYQDLTVINGSVVRLWDGDGELTPLPQRRWRGRTGISHSF